jgi:hypothetical protein
MLLEADVDASDTQASVCVVLSVVSKSAYWGGGGASALSTAAFSRVHQGGEQGRLQQVQRQQVR